MPENFSLSSLYPNPFSCAAGFRYFPDLYPRFNKKERRKPRMPLNGSELSALRELSGKAKKIFVRTLETKYGAK